MQIIIRKKGIVDCTSDSRSYSILTIREGIENAIRVIDNEVIDIDYADFYMISNKNDITNRELSNDIINRTDLSEYQQNNQIRVVDKKTCMKLLNYFISHPEQLTENNEKIHIHVRKWGIVYNGGDCSDYIKIFSDILEVSCQDYYDEEERLKFHNTIKELVGSNYTSTIKTDQSLISLHINVTEKCEANCNTCYVLKGLKRELEKEDWIDIPIAEQYAIGGGEPSEYILLPEFVDYLKNERKGYVAITTNGQKIINFNSLPDKIAISIDGLTQEQHSITHNTDLSKAESTAKYYKDKGIKICINHILHKENINNAGKFAKKYIDKGYDVNFILFTGKNSEKGLLPSYNQLNKFNDYLCHEKLNNNNIIINHRDDFSNHNIMIDSCMASILSIIGLGPDYHCYQGLYSKYYRFGTMTPCSHSARPFPNCSVMEEYFISFFKTLRPLVFIYFKDGTSGAHEWAFKAGYRGKIRHKIDNILRKDVIYILTKEEADTIREAHYQTYFEDKMPYWLSLRCDFERNRKKMHRKTLFLYRANFNC